MALAPVQSDGSETPGARPAGAAMRGGRRSPVVCSTWHDSREASLSAAPLSTARGLIVDDDAGWREILQNCWKKPATRCAPAARSTPRPWGTCDASRRPQAVVDLHSCALLVAQAGSDLDGYRVPGGA